jgi:hypothetical protein
MKTNLHFQRFEFKYYLPKSKADKLIPALLPHMNWDPYILKTKKDFYEVNSLYFDSPDFGCYSDKEAGVRDRKKLRYRFYDENSPIFLEIKRKSDALVIKDRIDIKDIDDKENKQARELKWFKSRNNMSPKLFVRYKRKALVGKLDPRFRITFDYDIETQLSSSLKPNPKKWTKVYKNGVVLELKFNNILPGWFHKIIQKFNLDRIAYSKYCNSLRQVIPALDDNNYKPN